MPREGSSSRTPKLGENYIMNNEGITMVNVSLRKQGGFDSFPLNRYRRGNSGHERDGRRYSRSTYSRRGPLEPILYIPSAGVITTVDNERRWPAQSQPLGYGRDGGRPNSLHRGLREEQPQSQEPAMVEGHQRLCLIFKLTRGCLMSCGIVWQTARDR